MGREEGLLRNTERCVMEMAWLLIILAALQLDILGVRLYIG